MKAIIDIQGQQHIITPGDIIQVNRYETKLVGELIEIKNILFIKNNEDIKIGTPFLENYYVKAKILEHKRGKKIIIFKKKRRKGYEKKQGHRQNLSVIKIEEIKLLNNK